MKSIIDIFGSLADNAKIPEIIAKGKVRKVNIQSEVRSVTLWVNFDGLIERNELFECEKIFSKSLNASVVIKPHFGSDLFNINYFIILGMSFILSIIGQIGDFSASSIKRFTGIKDYGNVIPGHGGMLDRFDSIIFIAPFAFFLLMLI